MLIRIGEAVLDYAYHKEYDDGSVIITTGSGCSVTLFDDDAADIRRFFSTKNVDIAIVPRHRTDCISKMTDDEVRDEVYQGGPGNPAPVTNGKVPDSIALPFKALVERQVEAYKAWDSDAGDLLAWHLKKYLAKHLEAEMTPRGFAAIRDVSYPSNEVFRKPR